MCEFSYCDCGTNCACWCHVVICLKFSDTDLNWDFSANHSFLCVKMTAVSFLDMSLTSSRVSLMDGSDTAFVLTGPVGVCSITLPVCDIRSLGPLAVMVDALDSLTRVIYFYGGYIWVGVGALFGINREVP